MEGFDVIIGMLGLHRIMMAKNTNMETSLFVLCHALCAGDGVWNVNGERAVPSDEAVGE